MNSTNTHSSMKPNQKTQPEMKTIFIDTLHQIIRPYRISENNFESYYIRKNLVRCSDLESRPFDNNLTMFRDRFGLEIVTEQPWKAKKGFCMLLNPDGSPSEFILGNGLVFGAEDMSGRKALPDNITPEYVSRYIRFIPRAENKYAAKLAAAIHCNDRYGDKHSETRQRHLMGLVMELFQDSCEGSITTPEILPDEDWIAPTPDCRGMESGFSIRRCRRSGGEGGYWNSRFRW